VQTLFGYVLLFCGGALALIAYYRPGGLPRSILDGEVEALLGADGMRVVDIAFSLLVAGFGVAAATGG